ncbi:TatD family hydrolase [Myxococcota bacterium]|nr:TatD family hydrolase [Myxococcota bacterium]MBU1535383.1 TatD family hydrolase [Myxococcota bacterium]
MEFFDTHCHLLMPKLIDHLPAVFDSCREEKITALVNMALGPEPDQLLEALSLTAQGINIRTVAGIHPHNAKDESRDFYDLLKEKRHSLSMIGEIGLDYHYNFTDPPTQRRVFANQLDLAAELGLPVVLHVREAHEECLAILGEHPGMEGSIVHCYTGDEHLARRYLDLGFYISFSGIVTFPGAHEIHAAARIVPQDRILAETDAPYLAPIPFRGKVCEPWHVKHTVQRIATLQGISLEKAAEITFRNATRAFRM